MRKTRRRLGRDRAFALLILNTSPFNVPCILSESVAQATYRLGGRDPRGDTWVNFCRVCAADLSQLLPHYSQSSRENATPSSGTSLLASYKDVPPPPPSGEDM